MTSDESIKSIKTIKTINPNEDYSEAMKIRYSVFVKEQGVPYENEADEHDKSAYHVVAFYGKTPVACGRIYFSDNIAKLGRVAVLKQYRHKGYAMAVCNKLLDLAVLSGETETVVLHAQKYIVGLYEKLGFHCVGREFLEENIPHIAMELNIKQTK